MRITLERIFRYHTLRNQYFPSSVESRSMRCRREFVASLGLAAAFTLGIAQTGSAQSSGSRPDTVRAPAKRPTATSTQRIKISKEAGGDVAPPDTVLPPPPPPPPVEEVLPPPPPPPPMVRAPRMALPLFFGIGGGLAFGNNGDQSEIGLGVDCIPGQPGDPMNALSRAGYNITVPIGWQPVGSPIGVRFDVAYSRYTRQGRWLADDGSTGFFNTKPQIWSTSADVKLRAPFTRISPYAVAGASWNRYRITVDHTGSDPIDNAFDGAWHNNFGVNAGGGLEFGFGRTALFVETRWFSGQNNVNHMPVILGLNFF
jgi:opacity protein-like surface antigen